MITNLSEQLIANIKCLLDSGYDCTQIFKMYLNEGDFRVVKKKMIQQKIDFIDKWVAGLNFFDEK